MWEEILLKRAMSRKTLYAIASRINHKKNQKSIDVLEIAMYHFVVDGHFRITSFTYFKQLVTTRDL